MTTEQNTVAVEMTIPKAPAAKVRTCRDGEEPCCVCGAPVKVAGKAKGVWTRKGTGIATTPAESMRLIKAGQAKQEDFCWELIGSNCLRQFPELKPYLVD